MIADAYLGALIGFLAVASVLHVANREMRAHIAEEATRAPRHELSASPRYRWGIGLLLIVVAYSNYALFFSFELEGRSWSLIRTAWLFASSAFGAALAVRAFWTKVLLRDQGLELRNPFRTSRMAWSGIERVEWDRSAWAFTISGAGTRLSVSVFMVGIRTLIDRIEHLAPQVELTEVRRTLGELAA